ncbi:MAG TPA: tRNA uridine-5-carboxymethylaminomethyl(34) synthesis GTPase MnmE [Phnomibacter sp.]|nr:tRNA uridine-5-carboxymethylaminomethyl(34) synthesis GTPase MnmE [Phnomibacter sp.]
MSHMDTAQHQHPTIVALATPPGIGALGVVRLSGPQAIVIANTLFTGKNLLAQPSHTLHVGWLKHGGVLLDEVVLSLYRAPRSFTGEDVVELSCHGSPYILQQVLQACTQLGAAMARPGEFTQRAFLNGKMDLAQAEAVADVIASATEASHRSALQHMRGGFSKVLATLREQLIQFSALIELELDFATEDVEFADRSALQQLIKTLQQTVQGLLQSFALGNVIKQGVSTAIIGKPNAGKSTLLNALLNENRAIVSDIAGTTRDTIEEVLNIEGLQFRLIDTAGIREHTADVIEQIGVEKSLEKMREADLVLYLFDTQTETPETLNQIQLRLSQDTRHHLLVGNKADQQDIASLPAKFGKLPILFIAAKTGLGIDALRQAMVSAVQQGHTLTEDALVTNARHYQALQQVAASLHDIAQGLQDRLPGDLLALDIRRCLHYLGEITGQITNEDQLDYIFSKFCIGK